MWKNFRASRISGVLHIFACGNSLNLSVKDRKKKMVSADSNVGGFLHKTGAVVGIGRRWEGGESASFAGGDGAG